MLVIALPARFPLRFILAIVIGALHAASFVNDSTWPLQIATLAGLVALVVRATRELAGTRGMWRATFGGARLGFGFGLGWFVTGISWIFISLHTYGEMNPVIAGAGTLALAAYLSLYPALACALYAMFNHARHPGPMASMSVFAGLWTLSELARGYVFTGFPWLGTGYAHVGSPLAGYAPIVGVYGVALIAAAIASIIALAALRRRRESIDVMLGRTRVTYVLVLALGVPAVGQELRHVDWADPVGKPISVRLIQGNVPQDVKFVEGRFDETAENYMKAIESKRADLIVLPETAFPRFLDDLPDALLRRIAKDAVDMNAAIAFGVPINEGSERYFNSVMAVDPSNVQPPVKVEAKPVAAPDAPPPLTADVREGEDKAAADDDAGRPVVQAQRYDKNHLVPFGEFVPTGFHWFVRLMNIPLGDFTRGTDTPRPMQLAGRNVAFNICYEDLFGEEIIRQSKDAGILVNVSNVAWFGDSMALPQHLDISRMRALETARPMLRATNTGMTAYIEPHGVVAAKLPPFTAGSLDVNVQATTGLTPFARVGNAAALALALALIVGGWFRTNRGLALRRANAA